MSQCETMNLNKLLVLKLILTFNIWEQEIYTDVM
jgi:hypothetical protein